MLLQEPASAGSVLPANGQLNKIMEIIDNLPGEEREYVRHLFRGAPMSLFDEITVVHIRKDTSFIWENTPADRVYLLVEGRVQAVEHRVLGSSYNYMRFSPVNSLGTMEVLLEMKNYRTTLMTQTDCTMLSMSRSSFSRWIHNDSNALLMETKGLGTYLLEEARRNRLLRFLSGKDSLLLILQQEYELNHNEKGNCLIQWTRQEISNYSGLSVRTVNRAIQSLEEEAFIDHHRGVIRISKQQYEKIRTYLDSFISEE